MTEEGDGLVLGKNFFVFGSFTVAEAKELLLKSAQQQQQPKHRAQAESERIRSHNEKVPEKTKPTSWAAAVSERQKPNEASVADDVYSPKEEVEVQEIVEEQEAAVKEVLTGKDLARWLVQKSREPDSLAEEFSAIRGFLNLGNTCFLNAVVQCVFSTPTLRALWPSVLEQSKSLQGRIDLLQTTPLLHELSSLYVQTTGTQKSHESIVESEIIRPDTFIYKSKGYFASQGLEDKVNVNQASQEFRVVVTAPQQDAHEYLEWLLDTLNDEQQELYKLFGSLESPRAYPNYNHGLSWADEEDGDGGADDGWEEVGKGGKRSATAQKVGSLHGSDAKRKTFITECFQGVLRSSVRTAGCKESVTLQPFMCLQLDVLNAQVKTLQDALELYMAPEMLTGLKPHLNGSEQRGQKLLLFDHLPPVLVFHLKRFVFDQRTGHPQKLRKVVSYPSQLTIPDAFLSARLRAQLQIQSAQQQQQSRQYELHAVCLHLGDLAVRGHYKSWIRSALDGRWSELDDTKVRSVGPRDVLNDSDAYLLFYHRK